MVWRLVQVYGGCIRLHKKYGRAERSQGYRFSTVNSLDKRCRTCRKRGRVTLYVAVVAPIIISDERNQLVNSTRNLLGR